MHIFIKLSISDSKIQSTFTYSTSSNQYHLMRLIFLIIRSRWSLQLIFRHLEFGERPGRDLGDRSFFVGRRGWWFLQLSREKKHGPLVEYSFYLVTHPFVHVLLAWGPPFISKKCVVSNIHAMHQWDDVVSGSDLFSFYITYISSNHLISSTWSVSFWVASPAHFCRFWIGVLRAPKVVFSGGSGDMLPGKYLILAFEPRKWRFPVFWGTSRGYLMHQIFR